jgi:hypothetical protein
MGRSWWSQKQPPALVWASHGPSVVLGDVQADATDEPEVARQTGAPLRTSVTCLGRQLRESV